MNLRFFRVVILALSSIALGLVFIVNAQDSTNNERQESILQARSLVKALMDTLHLPGFSVAVAVGDSMIWSEGFGYADIENNRPVTRASCFRIGSVSKVFTAAAAAKLYQEGKLKVDAPIQQYVPSFPDKGAPITTRLLLGHLSGIRHYGRNEFINTTHYTGVTDALNTFKNDTLLFTPGARYGYSSHGYVLISAVIEEVTGQSYPEYMDENIFHPIGMNSTIPDMNDSTNVNRVQYYSLDSTNHWVIAPYTDNSDRLAAGGFLSTSEDLAHFGSAHFTSVLLNSETLQLIFTSQKTTAGKETGTGFAWRIGNDSLGHTYYHHGGESIGGRAFLLLYPDSKITVALLTNLTFARFGEKEALQIARIFAGR